MSPSSRSVLATPEQVEAEALLLEFLRDPELQALQQALEAEIRATPQGGHADASATLHRAVLQWTNSLIMKEIALYRPLPALLYSTDDTPRTWLGHTIEGVGTSGDNPDKIYRIGYCDGDGRYELSGQIDMEHRPAQLIIDVGTGGPVPSPSDPSNRTTVSPLLATLTDDRNLVVSSDGRFRVTLGGEGHGPNHVPLRPGVISFGTREVLSNWATQRPARMSIRRLDEASPQPFAKSELKRRILADLPSYVRFWSKFPLGWMGGLEPNTVGDPVGRVGAWGFVAGLRFRLKRGEAFVITTTPGGARYTGIQIIDPWMIQPDARKHQASLNIAQATPNPDGTYTYVISSEDHGAANWLDTAGLQEGFAILRWQVVPPDATKDGLIRDYGVISSAQLALMTSLPRVTSSERRARLAARASYHDRLK